MFHTPAPVRKRGIRREIEQCRNTNRRIGYRRVGRLAREYFLADAMVIIISGTLDLVLFHHTYFSLGRSGQRTFFLRWLSIRPPLPPDTSPVTTSLREVG